MDHRQRAWLCESHPPEQLREWARRLALFRFCRAYGGHNNDGDALRLRLRSVDRGVVDAIGAVARASGDQPGWCDVDGDPVWLWFSADGTLDVHVQDPDDVWSVSEAAVRIAERLEVRLAPFAADRIDPPQDDWHCLAPQTHPRLFR